MIRVSWDPVILCLCVVYTHSRNVLGWLEYLWILGYSDIGGVVWSAYVLLDPGIL